MESHARVIEYPGGPVTQPQAKILAVDDDEHTRALLQDLVTGLGHSCTLAVDGPDALRKAAEIVPDLVLLDLMMPGLDGFSVLERLRADPATASTPVILITAIGEIDGKIRGLELGADDYLTKPFKLFELSARLNAALSIQRYRRLLMEAETQLVEARGTDPLTGAGTYAQLRDALGYEVARARRYSRPLSALLLGIEGLPELRKLQAADATGKVIMEVAAAFRRGMRESDRLFRLDDDDFVLLLPETDEVGATTCAHRMSELVAELEVVTDRGGLRLALTHGTATFPAPDVLAPEDLVRRASASLAAARDAGSRQPA
jgi:diguanylate cyclase (GGDEF)-like protein